MSTIIERKGDPAFAFHPGELLTEILTELDVSQAAFARAIGVSPMRVSHIVNGARPVTADLALRFGKAFGQTPQYWISLQGAYDLAIARTVISAELKAIKKVA